MKMRENDERHKDKRTDHSAKEQYRKHSISINRSFLKDVVKTKQ